MCAYGCEDGDSPESNRHGYAESNMRTFRPFSLGLFSVLYKMNNRLGVAGERDYFELMSAPHFDDQGPH